MTTLLLRDYRPIMHNNISIDEEDSYKAHTNLIAQKNFSEATALLNEHDIDGIRASLFNSWEQKLYNLAEILDERIFYSPYYYSPDKPTKEEFENSTIWSQYYE